MRRNGAPTPGATSPRCWTPLWPGWPATPRPASPTSRRPPRAGRVTLYGHLASRAELIDAAFARTLGQAHEILDAVDLAGDPRDALARLVDSSWQIVDQYRTLLLAAEHELPPGRIRAHHDKPMRRIRALIGRGQREGVFRADLPAPCLVAVAYSVMHGAAAEISNGRLKAADAARVITATLLAAYTPPDAAVPAAHGQTRPAGRHGIRKRSARPG
jgi:TetR/AcrR family transcriptional regulator, mexCD-oprJ operon repressor